MKQLTKKVLYGLFAITALASTQAMAAQASGTVNSMMTSPGSGADTYILVNVGGTYAYYMGDNSTVGSALSDALNSGQAVTIWGSSGVEFTSVTVYK